VKAEEPAEDGLSELDRALERLLVGDARVKVDPATGQILPPDGENSPLTDSPEPHTLT
jgi:hypothetical protein